METMRDDRKKTFKQMVDDSNNVVADELLFTSGNDFFKDINKGQIKKFTKYHSSISKTILQKTT